MHAYTFQVNVTANSVQFGTESVTVILDWTSEHPGASYNVSVVPQVPIMYTGNTRAQLNVLYNTLYDVSIVATLCAQSSIRTATTIGLNYGEIL